MNTTQQPKALQLAELCDKYRSLEKFGAELRSQHARIAELEARLSAIGAGGVEPLRNPASQQAVQAAVHAEDIRDQVTLALGFSLPPDDGPHFAWSYLLESIRQLVKCENDLILLKTGQKMTNVAPAHTAEGVPAQIETLLAELAEETEAADNWRRLALQFDNHRMQALGHLKAILHPDSSVDEYKAAELFLKAPPLDGEAVLAQRIAALAAQAKQGECSMTTKKTIAAINAEIPRLEQEMQSPADTHDLMDAVLNCPHTITHESITLRFDPKQKEGHNALAQLHHRLAAYDQEARQREMQLLSEIEALEKLALANLKQREEGA